eukprot:TRINITY_DN2490_c0_g1_i1.p1 TRINITY_DN2490_c0_g1~~TRINITY_DN2490_c0_g1_i1.p1  ORF type:complete len:450 (+),score=39.86 TRINITY_DN2490_c0_g1_i1:44-1393(+)
MHCLHLLDAMSARLSLYLLLAASSLSSLSSCSATPSPHKFDRQNLVLAYDHGNKTAQTTIPSDESRVLGQVPARGQGPWSVRGRNFVDMNGNIVYFSGVQWTGLETPTNTVNGLWLRSYGSHLDQMASLGFNMIRLSFAGDTLLPSSFPTNINYGLNPDLQGLNSLQVMDKIIEGAGQRGIKIILDYHRLHATTWSEWGFWWDVNTPESTWINNWVMLAKRYKGNYSVVGADLFNEPHNNSNFTAFPIWGRDGVNDSTIRDLNWRVACKRAGNAILAANSDWIIFVEGLWDFSWWGGNFRNYNKIPLKLNVANKLSFSTHDYGPMVWNQSWLTGKKFPNNLPGFWDRRWGFMFKQNLAPVWMGEFGTVLPVPAAHNPNHVQVRERQWAFAIRNYLQQWQLSWTWAFWGPDSRDTGGILSDDWWTPHQEKLDLLKPIMHPNFGPSTAQRR